MSIVLLWTAYEPTAHTTTMTGVRMANGIRRIAAKSDERQHHQHADDVAGVHARDEPPDELRLLLEQERPRLEPPDDETAQHDGRRGRARDSQRDHGEYRRDPGRVRRRLWRHDALQLALAEPLRVPGEALREGVAHEGRGRGAARLEAHPEPDERAAHERARITRQDPPRVQHDPEIHARPDAAEAQPLLDGDEDLADTEEPNDRHDEVEPLHQVHEPEGHPELARDDVEPHRREDEPQQDRDQRLERVADAERSEE